MQLFKSRTELLKDPGQLTLYKGYFDHHSEVLSHLDSLKFNQNKILMFGKEHLVPRLELWFGSKSYTYTGNKLKPEQTPNWLKPLQQKVTDLAGCEFNSVLINKYRDGLDYVSYHQDNEPELGSQPIIASLSFGATRKFRLRNLADNERKIQLSLEDGDLLIMGKDIQNQWQHELPKSKTINNTRYNLTFRYLY